MDGSRDGFVDAVADGSADADLSCPSATPTIGTPCTQEGQFCGPPCTDECSFCNIAMCSGGEWIRLEAFPAPCVSCGESNCVSERAFCAIEYSDVVGIEDSFQCNDLPADCQPEPSCECLEAAGVFFNRCDDSGQGVVVERFGG
ncbi:MAG: hypothetical protein AAGF12_20770 [Myxococcota bacterium]